MPSMPLVVGGSADLTPSNNTVQSAEDFSAANGRPLHPLRVRARHGGGDERYRRQQLVRPYGGTFLVFADYMPVHSACVAVGLSDDLCLYARQHRRRRRRPDPPAGRDGCLVGAIPNLKVFRPADANETARMWKYMLEHADGPAVTALTRQNLPVLDPAKYPGMKDFDKGAYVLVKADNPDVLLLATGSEVQLAMAAAATLAAEGVKAQVVSMPCWALFEAQDAAYKESVIPSSVKARVGVEAGIRMGWDRWIGDSGEFVGMGGFGASAPANTCFEKFGITAEGVVAAAKKAMQNR